MSDQTPLAGARVRAIACLLLSGLVVSGLGLAGCAAGPAGTPLPTGPTPTGPATGPSAPTPADPTAAAPTAPHLSTVPAAETGVPDSAIIPALVGLDHYQSGKEFVPYTGPARPCTTGTHPSDAQLIRGRPASAPAPDELLPPQHQSPDVIREFVAQYRTSTAASAAVAEVKADVARCPGRAGSANASGEWKWTVVQAGFAGDESVLVRLDALTFHYQANPSPTCCTSYYVAVVRQGGLVVTVTSTGWELTGGSADTAKKGATLALTYAATLRA